jgi:hypothetical protein
MPFIWHKLPVFFSRRSIVLWLALVSSGAIAQVNGASADCSSPKVILQRYVDAVGGNVAIHQIQTRTIEARESEPYTFKPQDLATYRYTFKWKAPNRVAVKWKHIVPMFKVPVPFASATFIFDGEAWSNFDGRASRNEETTPLWRRKLKHDYPFNEDPQNMMYRIAADPLMIARANELYSDLEADQDPTSYPGLCILRANGPDAWGQKRRDNLYFDAISGILRTWEIQAGSPAHKVYFHFRFDDYRQVGAVKFPFYVYFDFYKATFRYTKVVHNQSLSDSDFVPKPVKAVSR